MSRLEIVSSFAMRSSAASILRLRVSVANRRPALLPRFVVLIVFLGFYAHQSPTDA
jgi:hypothetical protein